MPGILDALISISRHSGSTSNFAPPPCMWWGLLPPYSLARSSAKSLLNIQDVQRIGDVFPKSENLQNKPQFQSKNILSPAFLRRRPQASCVAGFAQAVALPLLQGHLMSCKHFVIIRELEGAFGRAHPSDRRRATVGGLIRSLIRIEPCSGSRLWSGSLPKVNSISRSVCLACVNCPRRKFPLIQSTTYRPNSLPIRSNK